MLKLGSEHSLVPLTMGWIPPLYWRSPLEMLQLLLHGPITHGELLDGGLAAGNIIIQRIFLGIVGVLALVGLAALVRRPDLPGRRFYFVWLLLPPGTLAAYSLLVDSIWVPRYATTMLPLLFICVGAGVSALARHERPLSHLFLGVLIFLSLHSAVLQLSMIPSGSIREAVAILKKETSENDMDGIICAPDRVVLPFAFYWDGDLLGWAQAARQVKKRISPELFWLTNDLNNPAFRLERRPGFEDWRGKQDRIWLLTIRDWPGDRQTPHLRKYLADRMRETEQGLYRYSGLDHNTE